MTWLGSVCGEQTKVELMVMTDAREGKNMTKFTEMRLYKSSSARTEGRKGAVHNCVCRRPGEVGLDNNQHDAQVEL